MERYYMLYINKKEAKMKINLVKEGNRMFLSCKNTLDIFHNDDDIVKYNSNYYMCKTRKPIKELAISIKEEWVSESQEQLKRFEAMKF